MADQTAARDRAIEEVPPLLVRDTWWDENGTKHTEEGVLLGGGYLTEFLADGGAGTDAWRAR